MVAQAAHVRVFHSGVRETLAQLRQKYWVPRGRQVRSFVRKCVTCQKTNGDTFRPVSSAPLPPSRVSEGQAFSTTGVDYAGPLYVKGSTGDRNPTKVHIALFTCAVVRAVHLEFAEDLSSEYFIQAFRRFVSRRGVPERLFSDNAKNFKTVAKGSLPCLVRFWRQKNAKILSKSWNKMAVYCRKSTLVERVLREIGWLGEEVP